MTTRPDDPAAPARHGEAPALQADVTATVGPFALDVALDVHDGELLAVIGPNGSGKTTLMRCLAGLRRIDAGHITLGGDLLDEPVTGRFVPPEARSIGVVFQDHVLFAHLSALDNVAFGPRARGTRRNDARRIARSWLQTLDLAAFADRRPASLSGGQAQRVALARALAITPRLLLLDEPLAALDVDTRRSVRRELRHHLMSHSGARLLVTHDPADVYALADRVAVLDHGSVAQVGTVAEITAHPRTPFVASLVGINLLHGTVAAHAHGDVFTTAHGLDLTVVTSLRGPAIATVRPQSITVARAAADTSARNTLDGVIDDLERLGDRVRVTIAAGIPPRRTLLVAEITAASSDALHLRPGDAVVATLKATDIEVEPE